MHDLVAVLAGARIGATHNQYTDSTIRRERLRAYLAARRDAPILLVGEAAGYRGARVSGIPFTSERQLTGTGPAEASATVVHDALADLGATDEVLLWNVVPTHPGTECSSWRVGATSSRWGASRNESSARRTSGIPATAAYRRSAPGSRPRWQPPEGNRSTSRSSRAPNARGAGSQSAAFEALARGTATRRGTPGRSVRSAP